MAENDFGIPAAATEEIKRLGYAVDGSMTAHIAEWRSWYACDGDFFKVPYVTTNGRRKHRARASLHPARRVCREMASLILTEDTTVSVDAPGANKWLQSYLARANFWPTGQVIVEKAFAMGTAAWALSFNVRERDEDTNIGLRRYDARMIVPLSWDDEGVSECAFCTRVRFKGRAMDQLQAMTREGDGYHIRTWLFYKGRELNPERYGMIADFPTYSEYKPFGIFKPGIDNIYDDLSPYGASIVADAIGAVKAVDAAWDSIVQEVVLTQPRVFADESMLDVRREDGKAVPTGMSDDMLFRKMAGTGVEHYLQIFSPSIRMEQLRLALDTALAELGDSCGFGQNYFTLGKAGGIKTATEVVSDNSTLMRNVRKHENVIRGAIQDVVSALLDNARTHCAADIERNFGPVSVEFDDSVIVDTQTEKAAMLNEIAAGVRPKWHYLVKFDGMSEEEARAAVGSDMADMGF